MMLREGKENRLTELTDNYLKRDIIQKKKKKACNTPHLPIKVEENKTYEE